MAWVYFNPNPWGWNTDDCTVRALCAVLGVDWPEAYDILTDAGREMGLMPHKPAVMWAVLEMRGFQRETLPECPYCITVEEFAREHPRGLYVLATSTHILCLIDGNWLDSWDSGDEIPVTMWRLKYFGR